MSFATLTQRLESSRWEPHKLGLLASLPVTAVMLLLWIFYDPIAIAWFCLYPFWGGLWLFQTTPLRKMISTALLYGTLVPFLIWGCIMIAR